MSNLITIKPCSRCEGTGKEPGLSSFTCGTCLGTLKERFLDSGHKAGGDRMAVHQCPKCEGSGQYWAEMPKCFMNCSNCNGEGLVRLDKEGNPCVHDFRNSTPKRWEKSRFMSTFCKKCYAGEFHQIRR